MLIALCFLVLHRCCAFFFLFFLQTVGKALHQQKGLIPFMQYSFYCGCLELYPQCPRCACISLSFHLQDARVSSPHIRHKPPLNLCPSGGCGAVYCCLKCGSPYSSLRTSKFAHLFLYLATALPFLARCLFICFLLVFLNWISCPFLVY